MIIETRFKDIPLEQVRSCSPTDIQLKERLARWESEWRGKPVRIIVPATIKPAHALCDGPYFTLADDVSRSICPHIAEIGD